MALVLRKHSIVLGYHSRSFSGLALLFISIGGFTESTEHPIWFDYRITFEIAQSLSGKYYLKQLGEGGRVLVDYDNRSGRHNDVAFARLILLVIKVITALHHERADAQTVVIEADGESAVFVQMTILVVLTVVACDKCLRRCADIVEKAEPHGIAGIAFLRNLEIGLVTEIQFLHIIIY